MPIVDTNVLSEFMRQQPNEAVFSWMNSQPPGDLFTTTITVAEVRQGIAFLPQGRRRNGYEAVADRVFGSTFSGRILSFDVPAGEAFATIVAARRLAGRKISIQDGMIAAIALSVGMAVATRNVAAFEGCGIDVINPWAAA
jgi:predicted nucleic acid-binding protein